MTRDLMWTIAAVSLVLAGCSSRPREFEPMLANTASSDAEFQVAYATCQQLFVAGKLDSEGRLGSAGVGAVAGGATAAVRSTAAAAAAGFAGLGVAAATIVLLPFAVLGGAFGMSRYKRGQKEQAIKTVMEGCLKERGFAVVGWTKAGKKPIAGPAKRAQ